MKLSDEQERAPSLLERAGPTTCVTLMDGQERTPLLDSKAAAAMLGIPVGRLRRYAVLGHVPSVKFSRARNAHRFFESDAIDVLRQGGLDALDDLLAHRNGNGAVT
jgi:hypothetical protein